MILRETKLCCHKAVNLHGYSVIKMVDNKYENWRDPQCNKFVLVHDHLELDQFYIEMPYGEIRPKLATYSKEPKISSTVICCASNKLSTEQYLWTINQVD